MGPIPSSNLVRAAAAATPDQAARMKNQQYVASLRRAPASFAAPGKTQQLPLPQLGGVNKALAQPNPAKSLGADPRFETGGPSAMLRPQPQQEDL
jgi:hypothetical protein